MGVKPEIAIILNVLPGPNDDPLTSKEIAELTGLNTFKVATVLAWHMKGETAVSIPRYLKKTSKPIHTWRRKS